MKTSNTTLTAKEKKAAYNKQYRATHRAEIKEAQKKCINAKPEKYAARKRKWIIENREHTNNYYKQRYTKNPNKQKNSNLKWRYNLTIEQWNQMFVDQNGCCKICDKSSKECGLLTTDHSHITGEVRGLLCRKCNLGLRENNLHPFEGDITLLNNAIKYLN